MDKFVVRKLLISSFQSGTKNFEENSKNIKGDVQAIACSDLF
jgi:hypothetical protein